MIAKIIQFNYTTFDIIIGFYEENGIVGSRCINTKYCGVWCKHCGYCREEMEKYIDVENRKILIDECEIPQQLSNDKWNSWLEYWSFKAYEEFSKFNESGEIIIINECE
jgi:thiol-disulfide isomerase/thioredoxin